MDTNLLEVTGTLRTMVGYALLAILVIVAVGTLAFTAGNRR